MHYEYEVKDSKGYEHYRGISMETAKKIWEEVGLSYSIYEVTPSKGRESAKVKLIHSFSNIKEITDWIESRSEGEQRAAAWYDSPKKHDPSYQTSTEKFGFAGDVKSSVAHLAVVGAGNFNSVISTCAPITSNIITANGGPFKLQETVSVEEKQEERKVDKAVNPSHYQSFWGGVWDMEHDELQWLEAKQYENNFRDPEKFKAALDLQIEKYLDRSGKKDNDVQELMKAVWYIKFKAAYIAYGNKPIRVKAIDDILKRAGV